MTKNRMDDHKDHLERRCPRLGGPITFEYCRLHSGDDIPCWKIFDCWWETFDIVAYMKANLSGEQYVKLKNAQPKPKMTSLIELIEHAKREKTAETESKS